jgi:NAD(P)H-dependent FMN reductase/heme-degrading monooxygenase HmoA
MTTTTNEPYTLVNVFTPKDGLMDSFVEMQLRETAKLQDASAASGWMNNEVYRSRDGSRLIVVTRFATAAAQASWATTPSFKEHVERIGALLEKVESIPVVQIARHMGTQQNAVEPLRLAVITGSTREGRFGDKPANWIASKAAATGFFAVEQIDLRDVPLPFLGDPGASRAQQAAADAFFEQISAFDAYIFTVAEYNHGPTAVLKNALDHAEWARKPAGMVAYGGAGGARAVEQIRGIAAELQLVTTQSNVHISFADYLAISKGEVEIGEVAHLTGAADKMLEQLVWWGRALRAARLAYQHALALA